MGYAAPIGHVHGSTTLRGAPIAGYKARFHRLGIFLLSLGDAMKDR